MITLSIPDMSCGHCRASIEAALAPVPGITALRFDGERRQAEIEGDVYARDLVQLLDAIGFPAQVVS